MPERRRRRRRIFAPYFHHPHWQHWHPHGYGPFGPLPTMPPGYLVRMTDEEEREALEHHIDVLKEELEWAEARLKELDEEGHERSSEQD